MYLVQRKLNFPAEPIPASLPPTIQSEIMHATRGSQSMHSIAPSISSTGISYNSSTPQLPWAIGLEEKQKYDTLFRGSDQGTGLIQGKMIEIVALLTVQAIRRVKSFCSRVYRLRNFGIFGIFPICTLLES